MPSKRPGFFRRLCVGRSGMNRETAHTLGPEFPFRPPISLVRRTSSREAFSPALVHGAHTAPIAIAYAFPSKSPNGGRYHESFLPVLDTIEGLVAQRDMGAFYDSLPFAHRRTVSAW
jgi:hypothetical protein